MKIINSSFFFKKNSSKTDLIQKHYKDPFLLRIGYSLLTIGLVMIISSSYSATKIYSLSNTHFVFKHIFFGILSFLAIHIFAKQNKNLEKIGLIIWILSIIGLIGVLFFGHSAKGAARWINIFGISIQPSEFAKIGVIIQGAKYVINKNWNRFAFIYLIPLILIISQPDLGTSILIAALAFAQIITKNFNIKMAFISFFLIIFTIFIAYFLFGHVKKRIDTFLNPTKDIFGIGYQRYKSFLAMKNGGILGKGFGKGTIKDFLPDAHTDYVFSVIVEEFGIIGGFFVILLFFLLGLRVLFLNSENEYLSLIQYTTTLLILGQAWLNMASNLSIIPAKGLTLPLISYGGSGLVTQGIIFGILISTCIKKSENYN